MSEQEALWIQEALQGDDEAFGNLVEEYKKPVFSLCYRMLGNSKDAEDAAQESLIRAYQHLKKFDPNRSFATWLLSIAAHYCIDRTRKKRLTIISADALPAEIIADRSAPNPESEYKQQEKEFLIRNLMRKLKPTDRAAIILRYWHEYSEVEIAQALDLTVSAVKSRLFRARKALASAWIESEKSKPVNERRAHESPAF